MCPIQYSGKNCEFKISRENILFFLIALNKEKKTKINFKACPNICVNGMCVEDNGTFHCQCATGWSGLSCNQSTGFREKFFNVAKF
jgi:hypothetical protein